MSHGRMIPLNTKLLYNIYTMKTLGLLKTVLFESASPPPPLISRRSDAQLTTQALPLDIELISIWILRLWARISEDLGAIEVTELKWIVCIQWNKITKK